MHKARFMGNRLVLRYDNDNNWEYGVHEMYKYYLHQDFNPWENDNLICECRLDNPPLKKNDTIYLHELKTSVVIESIERSTDGTYTYLTSYEIEKYEDETTIKSKEYAEEVERISKERFKEKTIRSEIESKSWWQRLLGD